MDDLLERATRAGDRLRRRGQTIAVAESSAGGLISAALLAVPGASAFFVSGAVVYTRAARSGLLAITDADLTGLRPSTEAYALLLAGRMRSRHGTVWGVGETGAAGPSGNRYGDAPGHCCISIAGPSELSVTLETGSTDRLANMHAFAAHALDTLCQALESTPLDV